MTIKILKYEIPINDDITTLPMTATSIVCDIHEQDDKIFLWMLVESRGYASKLKLKIVGTGQEIDLDEPWTYIKTVHMKNGMVWHVLRMWG